MRTTHETRKNRYAEIVAEYGENVLYHCYENGKKINSFVCRNHLDFFTDYNAVA